MQAPVLVLAASDTAVGHHCQPCGNSKLDAQPRAVSSELEHTHWSHLARPSTRPSQHTRDWQPMHGRRMGGPSPRLLRTPHRDDSDIRRRNSLRRPSPRRRLPVMAYVCNRTVLVAMIMPWHQPARIPMHWIFAKLFHARAGQHRPALQLQARLQ